MKSEKNKKYRAISHIHYINRLSILKDRYFRFTISCEFINFHFQIHQEEFDMVHKIHSHVSNSQRKNCVYAGRFETLITIYFLSWFYLSASMNRCIADWERSVIDVQKMKS